MSNNKMIMGFGNPLLDIVADTEDEFLNKYGVVVNNAILASDEHKPMYDELVTKYQVQYVAGGATQNSIRVAQWMLQRPNSTAYVGSIGKNCAFGETLSKVANADGVTTYYYESDANPTGTCAVLVNGKDRSLIANLAAANDYKFVHTTTEPVVKAMENSEIFYSAGFFLTPSEGPQTMLHVAKFAAENNKIYCLNLSAPFLVDFFFESMSAVIPYADYIFCNESEAEAFAKKNNWDPSNLMEAAMKLASWEKVNKSRPRTVVFTHGKDPTIVACNGEVKSVPVKPIDPSLIKDTNGAGDAFVGGFLAQLAHGGTIEECCIAGHYAAGEVIQQSGCTFPPKPMFALVSNKKPAARARGSFSVKGENFETSVAKLNGANFANVEEFAKFMKAL